MPRQQTWAIVLQLAIAAIMFMLGSMFSGSFPFFSNGAAVTSTAPVFVLLVSSPDLSVCACAFDDASYQLLTLVYSNQGLVKTHIGVHHVFNPGADIDLTVTTDFEDVAAPVADISEFTNQERALLTDTMTSTVFWNGVMGGVFALSFHLILSADFWRFLS